MPIRLTPSSLFDSTSRSTDLGRRSAKGGVATVSGQLLRTLVQLVGTVVLARILTPDDYGVIGMATAVIVFAQMFRDAGLSAAVVQEPDITAEQAGTLFWTNLAVATGVSIVVAASAPIVAAFYGRSELTPVIMVLAVSIVLGGAFALHEALLRRHMHFGPIAASQAVGQTLNVITSILCARLGLGYWSLVVGAMVGTCVTSAVIVWACPWRPVRPRRGVGTRKMVLFGGHVAGFNLVNYFARNGDYILIGRFIGAVDLGIYTRAYQIFMQPLSQVVGPLASVAMPALSALRDDRDRYVAYYRRLARMIAVLTVPIAAYVGVEAEFVVRTLLGSQWLGAVGVLRWLAVVGLFQSVTSTLGLVLVSCGRSKEYLHMGIGNTAVVMTGFAVGLPFGIEGVAAGYMVANLIYWIPAISYFTKRTPIDAIVFWRALALPLAGGVAASGALLVSGSIMPTDGLFAHVVAALVFVLTYVAVVGSDQGLRRDVLSALRSLRSRVSPDDVAELGER